MSRTTTVSELLIRQRVNALARALPPAQKGDVRSIHQARVATRRLREALPLVADGKRGRKLGRGVRRLTRALGPVRELDVALLTLDEFAADPGIPAAGVARLRQAIRRERQLMLGEMRHRVGRIDLARLGRRAATAARKSAAGPPLRSRDPQRLMLARLRAGRRAERLLGAMDHAAAIYLPERLHEVRIAAKKLRYALELTRELSGSRATRDPRLLKGTQDLLGRLHDLEILITRIRALQGSTGGPSLRESGQLDLLVRRLETECRRLHGHYIASRRQLVAACDRAIHAAERSAAAEAA